MHDCVEYQGLVSPGHQIGESRLTVYEAVESAQLSWQRLLSALWIFIVLGFADDRR